MYLQLKVFTVLFLSTAAIAQTSQPVKLTTEETASLKIGMLEQALAEANAKIAVLQQQIKLYSTFSNHGWKTDGVAIQLDKDGYPEAVILPKPNGTK